MQTLFLKYRPQNFSDIVGQESTKRTLQNALQNGTPAHAYLFNGSRGTGKTSTARIVAAALLCGVKNGEPDNDNPLMQQIHEGILPDFIEIDAASNNSVEDIRDLREKIRFAPSIAQRKVYIIDEVHMLSKSAFNALLKTLEEPPSYAYFILATTEIHKVPETIISRCQVFSFQRFTKQEILQQLQYIADKEGFTTEPEALQQIAEKAEGGLRDAIGMLERTATEGSGTITMISATKALGLANTQILTEFWSAITHNNPTKALELLDTLHHNGTDMRYFGHDVLQFLRAEVRQHITDINVISGLNTALQAFQLAVSQLRSTPIKTLPYEIAVLELCNTPIIQDITYTLPKQAPAKTHNTQPTKATQETDIPTENTKKEPQQQEEQTLPNAGFVFESDALKTKEVDKNINTPTKNTNTLTIKQLQEACTTLNTFATKSLETCRMVENDTYVQLITTAFHAQKLQDTDIYNALQQALETLGIQKPLQIIQEDTAPNDLLHVFV